MRLSLLTAALSFVVSLALLSPADALSRTYRVFDPVTGQWETFGPGGGGQATKRSKHNPVPREVVAYSGPHPAGTIVVNTTERRLYHVLGNGKAMKYGVGVGREGFEWSGTNRISRKAEWPSWTPPAAMRKRQPNLPIFMEGGPHNPLGARAMYLGNTLYRIHGSNEPWTIGQAVSSGCIRMTNEDVAHLYDQVKIGAKVVVTR